MQSDFLFANGEALSGKHTCDPTAVVLRPSLAHPRIRAASINSLIYVPSEMSHCLRTPTPDEIDMSAELGLNNATHVAIDLSARCAAGNERGHGSTYLSC